MNSTSYPYKSLKAIREKQKYWETLQITIHRHRNIVGTNRNDELLLKFYERLSRFIEG